ncbi:alpha/beta fold hydrolase [Streptomyces flavofungini]|uniref:alpha/beta fold hydrolase n=1 Tax=Streptomyces flavofungini TaxID=68200 RepID=UPI0025B007EF|nr:alpha/beta hydrolase [Streptomyces flavofungini]WJV47566.1 alpha/beta hydrolase [Streptomyces flavofungini]
MDEPARHSVDIEGRQLSCLDFGGSGQPLLALHGHFADGRTFAALARALGPRWRLIAPDQRGHGWSERAAEVSRDGYVGDAVAVLEHFGLTDVVVLGHSLGGVNAYQLAARHPRLVQALVIEDIGAEVDGDLSFCLSWPHRVPTRAALIETLGDSAQYVEDAVREYPDGWGLVFEARDMVLSQELLNGDHWGDWLASVCPALLVHGRHSTVLSGRHAKDMAARRPRTQLVELATGHTVRESDSMGFAAAVRGFLDGL